MENVDHVLSTSNKRLRHEWPGAYSPQNERNKGHSTIRVWLSVVDIVGYADSARQFVARRDAWVFLDRLRMTDTAIAPGKEAMCGGLSIDDTLNAGGGAYHPMGEALAVTVDMLATTFEVQTN